MFAYRDDRDVVTALSAILGFSGPRRSTPNALLIDLDLEGLALVDPHSGEISLRPIVRRLISAVGLDEGRLPSLRLEHKLVQSLVMRHFSGDAFLETTGLKEAEASRGSLSMRAYLESRFPKGYCIKTALGYASPRGEVAARNAIFLDRLEKGELTGGPIATASDEEWIIQEFVEISVEYKVHTLEGDVLPGLTHRYSSHNRDYKDRVANISAAENFVEQILHALPVGLVKDSFCSWDIALTQDGLFKVIEVNHSGLHTVYDPGYHCSGIFQLGQKAPPSIALLISHIQRRYSVTVRVLNKERAVAHHVARYVRWIDWWMQLFAVRDSTVNLRNELMEGFDVMSVEELVHCSRHPIQHLFFLNFRRLNREVDDITLPSESW